MTPRRAPFHTDATDEVSEAIHSTLAVRYASGLGPESPRRFTAERWSVVHCVTTTHIDIVGSCWQLVETGLSVSKVRKVFAEMRELAKERFAAAAVTPAGYTPHTRTLIVDCSAPQVHQSSPGHCHRLRQTLMSDVLKSCIQQLANWNLLVMQGDAGGYPSKPEDVFAWALEDADLALRAVRSDLSDDLTGLWCDLTEECGTNTDVGGTLHGATQRAAAAALLGPAVVRGKLGR